MWVSEEGERVHTVWRSETELSEESMYAWGQLSMAFEAKHNENVHQGGSSEQEVETEHVRRALVQWQVESVMRSNWLIMERLIKQLY